MTIGSSTLIKALQKIGSMVNINIGSASINAYGDGSYFYAPYSGVGYIQVMTDSDDSVRQGVLNVGDAVGYFEMAAPFPTGSKIYVTHQGFNWETVGEPIVPHISGNQLLKTVPLKKLVS